ncbi:hypothetical protein AJ80_00527 [Polytolypa hystricis UAMH7299]|uniref:Uncharacterized protein n=1 Tax=Polytolypa hystricis (strain UAMH7299) TaxID=1447883 RepID=A0A2B7Z2W1_POLH7|nr:hypothetical protein AJ80_00527 [Polytolypa hystricis UAMH7299]
MASEYRKLAIPSLNDSLQLAVQHHNFKNGAFNGKISNRTPLLEGIDICLASRVLSNGERDIFRMMRAAAVEQQQGDWDKIPDADVLKKMMPVVHAMTKMFTDDMKEQGMYVPPALIQSYNPASNKTTKNITIDDEGNMRLADGGVAGLVPGAPAGFNAAGIQMMKDGGVGKGIKEEDGNKEIGSKNGTDEKKQKPSADNKANNNNAGFGKAFENNIRNAFL